MLPNDTSPKRPLVKTPSRRRGVSLQERVFRVLEERIQAGEFRAANALPSEQVLASQFAVSRVTIRAALERLAHEGRIVRIQGRGTLLADSHEAQAQVRISLTDVLSDMDGVARASSVTVVTFDYRPPPPEVAAMLKLGPGDICQHAVRLRTANGRVILHLTSFIPEDIGRHWSADDLANQPLQSLVAAQGLVLTAGNQVVTAVRATPMVAERLGIELGAPLLRVQRVCAVASGRPVEYVETLGPGTSFDLQMALRSF